MDKRAIDIRGRQNAAVREEILAPLVLAEPLASYNPRYQNNAIIDLTFSFAQAIWELADELEAARKYAVAKQLFRSGTAIGALVREAQNAESLRDFIHKMKIALKEADETEYWPLLCRSRGVVNTSICLEKLGPILRILNKILSTSHAKLKK